MTSFLSYLAVFLVGGACSAIAQLLLDLTKLTPARILVLYVVIGVAMGALGLYDPLYGRFGAGVSVPLIGFGGAIARGVREALAEQGAIGILTGPLTAAAGGTTAALLFGYIAAMVVGKRGAPPKRLSRA